MRAGLVRRIGVVGLVAMVSGLMVVIGATTSAGALSSAACPFADSETATECVVSGPQTPGTAGPFTFSKTLRVTTTGHIDGGTTGITINVNGAPNLDLVMEAGAVIEADDDAPLAPNDGALPITINVSGNATLALGSRISADNNIQGGEGGPITVNVEGNMTLQGTPGSDTCRTFDGSDAFDGIYGQGSAPSAYGSPNLGARISALRLGASASTKAGDITIKVGTTTTTPPIGLFTMGRCALVDASSLGSGGTINISSGKTAQIDGLVLSESSNSGTGAVQAPGGGPITIFSGCGLSVGDTGMVSSLGKDPGADLVHLESCEVTINGIVQSTTRGDAHALPNTPANRCNNDPASHPLNGATGFTGCVEIWAQDINIDASGVHNGNVNVDGIRAPMRGWIDLFATKNIAIIGEPAGANKWAVSADACPPPANAPCSNAFGGLITVKAVGGTVTTVGQAILQAHATAIGGDGGTIIVQANLNVDLDGSFVDATGPTGSNTKGGAIAVKSFNGAIIGSAGGKLDASGGEAGSPGSVSLVQCAAGPSQYLGTVLPATVPVFLACGGAPMLPSNATAALAADALIWERCSEQPAPPTLSGIKYNDVAGNHTRDGNPIDPLLPDWEITLWNAAQTVAVATTTTDANGAFVFSPIPGSYVICETIKTGWSQTAPIAGNGVVPCTSGGLGFAVTVANGQTLSGFDFGNQQVGSIGGVKFNDLNGSHTRDGSPIEPLLSGWEIKLWDATQTSVVGTTTTGVNGDYNFAAVPAGAYVLCETIKPGWTQTAPVAGSNVVPCTSGGLGLSFTLTAGQNLTGKDFGNQLTPPGKITGKKFNDANGNHYKDGAEVGLSGWTINLYDATKTTQLGTTTTDMNGAFSFDNLTPGTTYVVCEVFQAGWVQTAPVAGGPTTITCPNGIGFVVTVAAGQTASGKDFGNQVIPPGKITGKKFNDVNGNHYKDTGEVGLSGWTIRLYDATKTTVLGTTTTDVNGAYSFGNLTPGTTYVVCEVFQSGWVQTAPVAGGPTTTTCPEGIGFVVTVAAGQTASGKDFGNKCNPPGKITGKKYNDANGNHYRDSGEDGLSGWTINLYNADQTSLVKSDVTDWYGGYSFDNLTPGTTYVVCEVFKSGWVQTAPVLGGAVVACTSGGVGYKVTVSSGQTSSGKDFGNKCNPPGKITGKKYNDANGNHYRDSGEDGLSGWTIKLYNATQASVIATDVTDSYGGYSFDNLTPGTTYVVCEVFQSGWIQTAPELGTGKTNCTSGGIGYTVTVSSGQTSSGKDFGNKCNPPGKITGKKYNDANGNHYRDSGEDGLSGWTINLYDATQTAIVKSDVTDSYGGYSFDNLTPGTTYVVCEVFKSGWVQTAPVLGGAVVACTSGGVGYKVTVSSGQTSSGKDFGNKCNPPGKITGKKYNDQNGNHYRDSGEDGLSGWTIKLYNANQSVLVATDVTDWYGGYSFDNLTPGSYVVCEVFKSGWIQTAPVAGTGKTNCTSGGIGYAVTVSSGQTVSGKDFGNKCKTTG